MGRAFGWASEFYKQGWTSIFKWSVLTLTPLQRESRAPTLGERAGNQSISCRNTGRAFG